MSERPTKAKPSRAGRPRGVAGPAVRGGSREARRAVQVILEVLAGVRTPQDAAAALSCSPPRYYALEKRAFAGMVAAVEPRRRGPGPDPAREVARVQQQVATLERQVDRQQALLRATQRIVGVAAAPAPKATRPAKAGAKKRRVRRPTVRALQAAQRLAAETAPTSDAPASTAPNVTEERSP